MYDAFGKMGSDVEGGNVNQVGSLQECLSVKGPGFGGQYCQVFLKQVPKLLIKSGESLISLNIFIIITSSLKVAD